jgi:hypothetical protein
MVDSKGLISLSTFASTSSTTLYYTSTAISLQFLSGKVVVISEKEQRAANRSGKIAKLESASYRRMKH